MSDPIKKLKLYEWHQQWTTIAKRAVRRAQQESRDLGVPNVYSINGFLYYELPNGELSREDPYREPDEPPSQVPSEE